MLFWPVNPTLTFVSTSRADGDVLHITPPFPVDLSADDADIAVTLLGHALTPAAAGLGSAQTTLGSWVLA